MNSKDEYAFSRYINNQKANIEKRRRLTELFDSHHKGDLIIVNSSKLVDILCVRSGSAIRRRLIELGYVVRLDCEGYLHIKEAIKKEPEPEIIDDISDLKKLEGDIKRCEQNIAKSKYKKKSQLCKLLNLRKIYAMRIGDTESLLLGDFTDQFAPTCILSKYEEIRLGFEMLFRI